MLEIVGIVMFSKHLAGIAESKGRPKAWAALGAICWILGELLGGVVGALLVGDGLGLYAAALAGAALGAGIAWMIVNSLSSEGIEDDHQYGHADANNPYSPPGFGKRDD